MTTSPSALLRKHTEGYPPPPCPECGGSQITSNGSRVRTDGNTVQRWKCKDCGRGFTENPENPNAYEQSTPMSKGQVCVFLQEAKNLAPETDIKTVPGPLENIPRDVKGKILEFAVKMENQGLQPETIRTNTGALRALVKRGANILDPESVKATLAKEKAWSPNRKRNVINAYTTFLKTTVGLVWEKPKCTITQGIPFIPTEAEIDSLIAGSYPKLATFLQLLKETAMRSGEGMRLQWTDLDLERKLLTLNKPEKGGVPRQWPRLTQKLLDMLNALPRVDVRIFGPGTLNSLKANYVRSRRRLSWKLQNPRLLQIHFHTLRHWRATLEYHNTRDLLAVRDFLGHRFAHNTEIYVSLEKTIFQNQDEAYITKIARSIEEAARLVEVGFEYVTGEYEDGGKLFRKRRWT